MGPELVVTAAGYYAAILIALLLLVGMAIKRSRMTSVIIASLAAIAGVVACATAKPGWEIPSASFYFAAAGIASGSLAAAGFALRGMFRALARQH